MSNFVPNPLSPIEPKYQYIGSLAAELHRHNIYLPASQLAEALNDSGFLRDDGTEYSGLRGTHRAIRAAYDRFAQAGQDAIAMLIAQHYRDSQGNTPWLD